jgi:branched-chain amino acid transport system ATP-binding protein
MTANSEMNGILHVTSLSHSFGGVKAVNNFNLSIDSSAIWGIIGPNGAGKTTVFNLITGVYKPDSGAIRHKGINITGISSHKIVGHGISRTFQNIRLFKTMSVLDNVRTAGYGSLGYSPWSALLRTPRFKRLEQKLTDSSAVLLDKFGLHSRMYDNAAGLPYGLQRKVELARALISKPSVLLLDEPGAGMNPAELDNLSELILWIRSEFKVVIILIEHRMQLVTKLCEFVKVLNFGETIFEGKPGDLGSNPAVVKAYFGEDHETAFA